MQEGRTEKSCTPEARATHRKLLFPRAYMDFRAGKLRVKICSLPPNSPSVHNEQSSGTAENQESSEYSRLWKLMSVNKTSKMYVWTSIVHDGICWFSLFPKTFDMKEASAKEMIPKSVDPAQLLIHRGKLYTKDAWMQQDCVPFQHRTTTACYIQYLDIKRTSSLVAEQCWLILEEGLGKVYFTKHGLGRILKLQFSSCCYSLSTTLHPHFYIHTIKKLFYDTEDCSF